jgi:plasmid stabilization system protein ParE
MKISWSPLAAERLEDIYDYILVENKVAAQKVVERIFKKVESLAKNPERGRIVPETNRAAIREVFEGEYRIIYRIESKRVSVLTIRNFKQLLPDKDIK